MTKKDISQLAAETAKMWEEGAELMWRNALADIVIQMLERDGSVTRDSIKDELMHRIADNNTDRLTKATMQGALKGLDGRMPAL